MYTSLSECSQGNRIKIFPDFNNLITGYALLIVYIKA